MMSSRNSLVGRARRTIDVLLAEIDAIELLVAGRRADHDALAAQIDAFRRRYLRTVGERYAQFDELQAYIAEINAKRDPAPEVQARAAQASAQAAESRSAFSQAEADHRPDAFTPGKALKSLYRKVMRAVHPDTAGVEQEDAWRHEMAVQVNQAFEDGDEQRLRELLETAEERDTEASDIPHEERVDRLRRRLSSAERALVELEEKVHALKRSEMYRLMWQVERLAEQGRDLLAEMCAKLDAQIAAARIQIDQLEKQQEMADGKRPR